METQRETWVRRLKEWLQAVQRYAKRLWQWLLRKDILTYLLFVGLATLVWWGRAMSSQRDTTITLPIVYTDVPEQVVFDTPLPKELKVTIRDNGKQLQRIGDGRLILTLSMVSQLAEQEGTVHIAAEILRPKLQDMLPGSTVVQQVQPEVIEAGYHRQEEKDVEVRLMAEWTPAPQYQMRDLPLVEPQEVRVYGKKADLRNLRYIPTEPLKIKDIRDTMHCTVGLDVPEGLRVVPQNVSVLFVTEQFTEKTFTLPVETYGCPEGQSLRLFPQTVTVQARVGMSHFNDVREEDFHVICHFPKGEQVSVPVEVECDNPYVTRARTNPSELEYIIER